MIRGEDVEHDADGMLRRVEGVQIRRKRLLAERIGNSERDGVRTGGDAGRVAEGTLESAGERGPFAEKIVSLGGAGKIQRLCGMEKYLDL